MDSSESTKIVYNRIQEIDPENVSKIIGYLLLQDHGKRGMIRLAFSPDNWIQSLVTKAKLNLGLSSKPDVYGPIGPQELNPVLNTLSEFTSSVASADALASHAIARAGTSYWDPQCSPNQHPVHNLRLVPAAYRDEYRLQIQLQFLSLEDNLESDNYYHPETTLAPRARQRYFHGHPMLGSFSHIVNTNSNEDLDEDFVFSRGSFEKLEVELRELLKSRRGFPVSIASLPMLYYGMYRKTLQAEGCLTESQRHGKAGFSLTKLLAQLRNSIRVIDRPHWQHSVILVENFPKYMVQIGERNEHSPTVDSSRQIYLTCPAECKFTELDVSNYFNNFGPVKDVRISCQQKRMFGFISFVFAETVKQILKKGNPHFVCGAHVLVKPYREKSMLVHRKCLDKIQDHVYNGSHFPDAEPELHRMPRDLYNSILMKQLLVEEHEHSSSKLAAKLLKPSELFWLSGWRAETFRRLCRTVGLLIF